MLKTNSTAKAGWILPNVEYTKPKILGVIKAPYAATAATKPVIKEDNSGLPNTCGIIRNVAPVAKPQLTKVNTDIAKKNGKLCISTPTAISAVVTHRPRRLTKVTFVPLLILSANQPPTGRSAPDTSGPTNAIEANGTSGNSLPTNRPSAAA